MISVQLLEAVLEVWDELPSLLGLDVWNGLYRRIEPLLGPLRTAATDDERARCIQNLIQAFQDHPAAQRRLSTVFDQIRNDRSGPSAEPLPEWPDQIATLDRLLHPRTANRYTQVLAPRRAARASWQSITVRLTLGPESPGSLAFAVEEDKSVEVSLQAVSAGIEIAHPASAKLWITGQQDTAPVAFLFRGQEAGPKEMLLDFRQDEKPLGQVPLLIEITAETGPEEPPREIRGPVFGERPIPQPVDLEWNITLEPRNGKTALKYRLHSPSGVVDFHDEEIDGCEITGDPEDFRAGLLEKIEKLQAGHDVDDSYFLLADVRKKLDAIGRNLYDDLFSPDLRRIYREIRKRVRTIQVTSREPYIPWELIKPYDDEDSLEDPIDDDFLGCRFQMTRWLAGRKPPAAEIQPSRLACVEAGKAPNVHPLPYAAQERARLADLARAHGIEDASPSPATFETIETLLAEGRVGIFHVVAHGDFSSEHPDESSLLLEDGRSFRAEDLQGPIKTGIRKSRPLVFLNACRVGQQGWALAGLGGWARRWVERCGCGGFVAPLWSVKDRLACEFARTFYDALEKGETFGAAAQAARLHVRETAPALPTWLAYSVYGHPNGRVVLWNTRHQP